MKRELLLATRNKKKFREIKRLFKGSKIRILSLDKFPAIPEVAEDKDTFAANAIKKAVEVSACTEKLVLADDSGLEVASLDGEPGVRSSRYAGPKKDDRLNNLKLLRRLKNKPAHKRKARFTCAVALALKKRLVKVIKGTCAGRIGFEMDGGCGFGYDPVFIPDGCRDTFARLGPKVKDRLSHRAKALRRAKDFIEGYLSKAL